MLTLEQSLHVFMNFCLEGQKILFRMVYAILKINHDFLMKLTEEEDVIAMIRDECLKSLNMNNFLQETLNVNFKTTSTFFMGNMIVNY